MSSGSHWLWQIAKGFFEGPGRLFLPEHTRDALFQLLCDLRTNSPKDRHWAYSHGKALKPRSPPGWIALGSFLSAALSVLFLASSAVLIISLGLAWLLACLANFIGVIVGFWTVIISGCLFVGTFLSAGLAFFLGSGYLMVATVLKIARIGQTAIRRMTESQGGKENRKLLHDPSSIADEAIQMQPTPVNTSNPSLPAAGLGLKGSPNSDSGKSSQSSTTLPEADLPSKKSTRTFAQLAQEPRDAADSHVASKGLNGFDGGSSYPLAVTATNEIDHAPPDLSPGRAELHPYFADPLKASKGSNALTPEGGPTVEGKFAEAVHPEAISRHINGLT